MAVGEIKKYKIYDKIIYAVTYEEARWKYHNGLAGGGISSETDPVFMSHPAHDVTVGMIDVLKKLSLVDDNLQVDTNLYATGGVSAYGYGKDDSSGGGWIWDTPVGEGNVVTKVEYDNGHLKVTYGTIEASSGDGSSGGGSSGDGITLPIAISNVSGLQAALDKKWEYSEATIKAVKVDNAVAADKLATARKLWGQSFDGTANVQGSLTFYAGEYIDSAANIHFLSGEHSWNVFVGDSTRLLTVLSNGNVGVGTISPQSKLHVNGAVRIGNAVLEYDSTNKALKLHDPSGNPLNLYTTGGISAYGVASGGYESIEKLIIDKSLQIGDNCYVTRWINKGYEHLYIYSENNVYMGNQSTYFDSDGWLYMTDSMLVMDEGGGFYKRKMLDGTKATTVTLNDDSLILQNGHSLKIGNTASDHNITDVYADGSYVYITINNKQYKLQNA